MKMIWHLVKKDLRAIWPLWLAWLGFIAVRIPLLLYYLNSAGEKALALMSLVCACALLADSLLVVSLVRSLVHEDALAGDKSFWVTRPITGVQLLVAKLASSLLVCVVSPLVLLLPTWFWFGFDEVEIGHVLTYHCLVNSGLVAVALLFAVVTRRGSSFWLVLLSSVVAVVILAIASSNWLIIDASRHARLAIVYAGLAVVLFGVVQQFIKRRTWIAQGSLGVGALITALLLPHWPGTREESPRGKLINQPLTITWNGVGAYFAKKEPKSSLPDYVKGRLEIALPKEYSRVDLQLLKGEWCDLKGNIDQADWVDPQGSPEEQSPTSSSVFQKVGQDVYICNALVSLSANWLWNKDQPWTHTGFSGRFRIRFIQTVTVADLKPIAGANARTGSFVTRLINVKSYKNAVKIAWIEAKAAGSSEGKTSVLDSTKAKVTERHNSWFSSAPLLWIRLEHHDSVFSSRGQEAGENKAGSRMVDDPTDLFAGGETHENLGELGWYFTTRVDQIVGYNDYDLKTDHIAIYKDGLP